MNKLRIGVLGVSGHFLKRIVLPLQKSEEAVITGIASRDIQRARSTAKKYDIPKFYGSYEELLNDKEIEAVFIPLPNHMHKEWIIKSIDARKHVLCEKPLTMNTNETIDVIEHAENSEFMLMEAFMYGFHPKWQKAKEIIDLGYIGIVSHIHTVFSYSNHDPDNIRNIKEFGGGSLMDIGCYAINSARYLLGKEPERVVALISEHEQFKTDELTSAILDFGDSRALFSTSTTAYPQQEVKAYGSEGTLTVTIPFNDISEISGKILLENNESKEVIEVKPANHYLIMFDEFAKAVRKDNPAPLPLRNSLGNMKIIDAIFESAKNKCWVDV